MSASVQTSVGLPTGAGRKKDKFDIPFWKPYITSVLLHTSLHRQLSPDNIAIRAPTADGCTHPTFMLGDSLVLKFYKEDKGGEHTYNKERLLMTAFKESGIACTPHVLATGSLEEALGIQQAKEHREWRWPFLVMTLMPGRPLSRVSASLSLPFLTKLARIVHSMHHVQLPPTDIERLNRDFFPIFLRERLDKVHDKHKEWGQQEHALPPKLVAQLASYLPKKEDISQLLSDPSEYTFLHGDLHGSNILVTPSNSSSSSSSSSSNDSAETGEKDYDISGLIDLGDALCGDPIFDLVPLYSFVLRFDKASSDTSSPRTGLTSTSST